MDGHYAGAPYFPTNSYELECCAGLDDYDMILMSPPLKPWFGQLPKELRDELGMFLRTGNEPMRTGLWSLNARYGFLDLKRRKEPEDERESKRLHNERQLEKRADKERLRREADEDVGMLDYHRYRLQRANAFIGL